MKEEKDDDNRNDGQEEQEKEQQYYSPELLNLLSKLRPFQKEGNFKIVFISSLLILHLSLLSI